MVVLRWYYTFVVVTLMDCFGGTKTASCSTSTRNKSLRSTTSDFNGITLHVTVRAEFARITPIGIHDSTNMWFSCSPVDLMLLSSSVAVAAFLTVGWRTNLNVLSTVSMLVMEHWSLQAGKPVASSTVLPSDFSCILRSGLAGLCNVVRWMYVSWLEDTFVTTPSSRSAANPSLAGPGIGALLLSAVLSFPLRKQILAAKLHSVPGWSTWYTASASLCGLICEIRARSGGSVRS
mmetsp:Transcript_4451/g.11560  ORF Transcript_4451/g.11560 Transcript_4451/m.11560 type:complete len:234 (+) Transcript_4451:112-813(+)